MFIPKCLTLVSDLANHSKIKMDWFFSEIALLNNPYV